MRISGKARKADGVEWRKKKSKERNLYFLRYDFMPDCRRQAFMML
jgi:hypothetical protein